MNARLKARHLVHEAVLGVALAIGLIVALTLIDTALGVAVTIMLIGVFLLVIPVASILYDERPPHRRLQ